MSRITSEDIIFSFSHVDSGVGRHILHSKAHRVLPNATQTRKVNTLNAQDTSVRYSDSSGRDLFAAIKHQ